MTCAPLFRFPFAVPLCVVLVHPPPARSQATSPTAAPIVSSRLPFIALAQPPDGVAIPQDRPALVFRFGAADASDPLDLGSLRIVIDGRDVTARFQVIPNEAWGKIDPLAASGTPMAVAGLHAVSARICTLRGLCGAVAASINVSAVAPDVQVAPNAPTTSSGPQGLIGALVKVARKIIGP